MNANEPSIQKIADMLDAALHQRHAIDPVVVLDPALDVDDAYAIQLKNIAREVERGARISGKKIGLTSQAMQNMLGVHEPDYGHLLDRMDAGRKPVATSRLLQPRAEGEIAFVMKDDLKGPNASVEDVLAATDYVVGAIEIVDSRVRDWKIQLIDTVADNGSSGLYVLGEKRLRPGEFSLPDECMQLFKNDDWLNAGCGADVLGNPALCVAWLANKLHHYGVVLRKGEVVLSGALSAATPVKPGDQVRVMFNQLGTVTVDFE